MAGLKGSTTEIGADGRTVMVRTESEHTAREIQAELENKVRQSEGGPGAKFNIWLKNSLDRFDETLGLYGDRQLAMIRDGLMICAMAMAIFACWWVLPGYELLMCSVGVLIVWSVKAAAGNLDHALQSKNGFAPFYIAIMVVGLLLEATFSTSLQAKFAVDAEQGAVDIDAQIKVLNDEQTRLNIAQMRLPDGTSDQLQALVDSYRSVPMVSRVGSQLTRTVGQMKDATECNPDTEAGRKEKYYIGIYCPNLLELEGKLSGAKLYETDKLRIAAIPAEIAALQAKRPHNSSIGAMGIKMAQGSTAWWAGLLLPVCISVLLMSLMTNYSYLAGRAKRTPLTDPPAPAPAP